MTHWNIPNIMEQIADAYQKEGLDQSWPLEMNEIKKALETFKGSNDFNRYCFENKEYVYGVGGSGVVLKLADKMFNNTHVALKFPRPVNGQIANLSSLLSKEIDHLVELKHPGIVNIIQKGLFKDIGRYNTLPYYIMEGVVGESSDDFFSHFRPNEQVFIEILRKTAEIISYMHNHPCGGVVHLDVKPKNIVIKDNSTPIMIDLGTCKHISNDIEPTLIACTRSFACPSLVRQLSRDPSDDNRARGNLKRCEINLCWDLFPLGLTILSWLGIENNTGTIDKNAIFNNFTAYTRKYLLLLVGRLLSENIPNWLTQKINLPNKILKEYGILNADQLLDAVARIDGQNGPIYEVPEIDNRAHGSLQTGYGQHVVTTKRVISVVEHRLFRRLNSITQLGLVYQVYPGAKHTRREHSLGTYANIIKIIKALWNDKISPFFRQLVSKEDIADLLLTSLLHDIGQFPFAHELEEIDSTAFKHSKLSRAMIRGQLYSKKKGAKKIVFEPLDSVFNEWETTPDRILSLLDAKATNIDAQPMRKLLRAILSGPIDGDKLDYLIRDGRQLNLPYPEGIDTKRLYECLTTVVIPQVGNARNVPALGVHARGRAAAEFLTFTRYTMYLQAYWHHAVRSQKAMLGRAVLSLLCSLRDESKINNTLSDFYTFTSSLPEILYIEKPLAQSLFKDIDESYGDYKVKWQGMGTDLAATDTAVLYWFRDRLISVNNPCYNLIDGILCRNLYKRLWVISRDHEQHKWDNMIGHWDSLNRDKRYAVSSQLEDVIFNRVNETPPAITGLDAKNAVDLLNDFHAGKQPWLLVDVPGRRPGSDAALQCVIEQKGRRLRKDNKVVGDLRTSPVWDTFAYNIRQCAGKIRVFCHPDLHEIIDSSVEYEHGISSLNGVLEDIDV
jgi:HD superfamily phosphohydrolase